jgi:iron complex outermembrane recepter protein
MVPTLALAALLVVQDPAPPARPDSATFTLPDISVLGDRQPKSFFDAPLAATEVQPDDVFGRNGTGLDGALRLVPGVIAQSRAGNHDVRIVIRGFGARGAGDRSNSGTARGVRVLVDGFPETEPDGRTAFDGIDLGAAERIEVVRSNVSSTWGNAAGGVVSVSTTPVGAGRRAEGETLLGAFGLRRVATRAHAVVGGRGVVHATLVRSVLDGWREHSASDRLLLNAGASIPAAPHTRLTAHFLGTINDFRIPGPLTAAELAADPRQANATYRQRDERRLNRVARLGLAARHGEGRPWGLTATAFAQPKDLTRSERGTFREFDRWHVGGSLVGRGAFDYGSSLRGAVSVGLDEAYQNGPARFWSLSPEGGKGATLESDQREGANSIGVFAQHQLELGDRLALIAGARYDVIRYSYEDELVPRLDAARSFSRLTPKLAVNYRLGPAHSAYASLGGGVEAPAGNETDPSGTFGQDTVIGLNPLLEPIVSTTWELGTRQALGGGSGPLRFLTYDAALYYTRVRNEIVPYRGGRFYFSAGRVRRMGAELGLRAELAGGLSLGTALTWSDNEYLEYVVDSVHYGRPGATADYSDNRIVGVPAFIGGAQAAWEPRVAPLRAQVALDATAGYWADDANSVRVPGYSIWSLTLGTRDPVAIGGGVAVGGFVTLANLFDRAHVASAFLNPDVVDGVPVAFEPGLPRHLLISLSVSLSGRAEEQRSR